MNQPAARLIDLHVHSAASDGSLSPAACVDEAVRRGLAAIALTDHDTTAGNAEALARGRQVELEVVPGVEVSSSSGTRTVHLLGYYPEPEDPGLEHLLERLRGGREERNAGILERLADLGCPVRHAEVAARAGSDVVGRPHIAAELVHRGYVATSQEAFDRYLARGGPAYVARWKPTATRAVAVLRQAGAVPVLAHPGAMGGASARDVEAIVVELARAGLRGIEVHYSTHSPGQTAAYRAIAARHGLLETGGTDFHGAAKPHVQMGTGLGHLAVPYELLARLKDERERLLAARS